MGLSAERTAALAAWLRALTGAEAVTIERAARLGGGVIQENWAVDLIGRGGRLDGRQALVLRTDAPSRVPVSWNRAQEYRLLEVAHRAGRIDASLLERHRYVLGLLGLPTTYSGAGFDELLDALRRDKKTRGATLRFVVLDGVAEPARLEGPDEQLLREAYTAIA